MSGSGIEQICAVVGKDAALKLCRAYGGISHYVPQRPRPDHPWAGLIGLEAWERLCAHYGGTRLTLPKGEYRLKRERVLDLLREGHLSVRQIAQEAGVTERYVSKLRGQVYGRQSETAALPLFGAAKEP